MVEVGRKGERNMQAAQKPGDAHPWQWADWETLLGLPLPGRRAGEGHSGVTSKRKRSRADIGGAHKAVDAWLSGANGSVLSDKVCANAALPYQGPSQSSCYLLQAYTSPSTSAFNAELATAQG